jgi:hypothetical protein
MEETARRRLSSWFALPTRSHNFFVSEYARRSQIQVRQETIHALASGAQSGRRRAGANRLACCRARPKSSLDGCVNRRSCGRRNAQPCSKSARAFHRNRSSAPGPPARFGERHSDVFPVRSHRKRGSTRLEFRSRPGYGRILPCDGRRGGGGARIHRFPCRLCLARLRRRLRARGQTLRLGGFRAGVSRTFRLSSGLFVRRLFTHAPQIRSQRCH